jgi:hypothetical protein
MKYRLFALPVIPAAALQAQGVSIGSRGDAVRPEPVTVLTVPGSSSVSAGK